MSALTIRRLIARFHRTLSHPALRIASLFFAVTWSVWLSGCDTAKLQDQFEEDAFSIPENYTETDQSGVVVQNDADDWRVAPAFSGKIIVDPIYPNPTSGGLVVVPFRVLEADPSVLGIFIRAVRSDGSTVPLGESFNIQTPGFHDIRINPANIGSLGLSRLFVVDNRGQLVSYGDILVR